MPAPPPVGRNPRRQEEPRPSPEARRGTGEAAPARVERDRPFTAAPPVELLLERPLPVELLLVDPPLPVELLLGKAWWLSRKPSIGGVSVQVSLPGS
jgi:hypothetical protein